MTEIADLAPWTYWTGRQQEDLLDPAPFCTSIGFLGNRVPENLEPPPPAHFAERLLAFHLSHGPMLLHSEFGYHTCGLCSPGVSRRSPTPIRVGALTADLGCGFILVPGTDTIYAAPSLIVHYIVTHGYRPPAVFLRAVESSPLPSTKEYLRALRRLGPPQFRWANSFDEYAPARWRTTLFDLVLGPNEDYMNRRLSRLALRSLFRWF